MLSTLATRVFNPMETWHMLTWHSHECARAGGKLREPLLGENFSGIEALADSLLREAVQNSLDARLNPAEPVHVRIYVSGTEGALSSKDIRPWMTGAWPHLERDPATSGVTSTEPCQFVVVEDFNTRGLQGDIHSHMPEENESNPWFLFFRVEGQSKKADDQRGRWGVGKVVFPLSSRARAFFAATVRADDSQRLVMGQAMLRSRRVNGKLFDPDLWFCELTPEGFELPSTDADTFEQMRRAFSLRRNAESGLSVVIPYADGDITRSSILLAAIREYFFPILTRNLVITVEAHGSPPVELDSGRLLTLTQELPEEQRKELLPLVEMATWLIGRNGALASAAMPDPGALRWRKELIPEEVCQQLRSELDAGLVAGIRIATRVMTKTGEDVDTHFDVVLRRSDDSSYRKPSYVRSDLVIPEVKGRQLRGYHSLVVARDRAVVTMLGDAENPAHTDWHVRTAQFKEKYRFAPSQLEFVKHSAAHVCNAVSVVEGMRYPDAIAAYFYVAEPNARIPQPRATKKSGGEPPPHPTPPAPARPRPFALAQSKSGFKLSSSEVALADGRGLEVCVAYDCRSGDPLKRFDPADFKLSQLQRTHTNLTVVTLEANRCVLRPTSDEFVFDVRGFDEHRDLFVRVREVEVDA